MMRDHSGNITRRDIVILVSLFFLLLLGSVLFFHRYAFFFIPLFLVIIVGLFKYGLDPKGYYLIYLSINPLLQHFNSPVINSGDFYITPQMVFQFFILLMCLADYFHFYTKSKDNQMGKIDKRIIIFAAVAVLSLIFGYTLPENAVKRWLLTYTGIFETTSFYFITLYLLKKEENFIYKILVALMISIFSSGIVALIELNVVGYSIISIFFARMRIGFGFHNTNLFGIYSVILFPLIVYLIGHSKSKRIRILSSISFGLLCLLSILCFNRGTFTVVGLQMLLFLLYTKDKKIFWTSTVVMVGAGIYFSKLLLFYLIRFVGQNNAQGLDESAIYRLEAWRIGFNSLFLYPFGVGAGGFQLLWEKYSFKQGIYMGTPHQLFLSIGNDYGLLTLLFFVIILFLSFRYSYRISKSGVINSSLFKYIIIALIGYILFGSITDGELSHLSGFIAPNNGYSIAMFAVFAIISYTYSRIQIEEKQ
jgi:hypothetical protein